MSEESSRSDRPQRRDYQTKKARAQTRAQAEAQIERATKAMQSAIAYGLVHSLEEAIERNRARGWADDDLRTFRLKDDDEVREVWAVLQRQRRDR